MKSKFSSLLHLSAAILLALFPFAGSAVAGPPLICHAFDIGNAKSLPWISHDWNLTGSESYDTKNLAADTIVILDNDPTVLVHMETLRRATLFARKDPLAARQLLTKLTARADSSANSAAAALAFFDFGYLAEAYKQWMGQDQPNPAQGLDGYVLVKKAIRFRGGDPQMELAASLITINGPAAEHQDHAQKAIGGAKSDPLLARNLSKHFWNTQSETMADFISHSPSVKVAKQ
ncbi:MAG: hypothetical protein WBL63_09810 [Candidatus Acidiferrum sp.]